MTPGKRDDLIEFLPGQFARIAHQVVQVHQPLGQMDERFDQDDCAISQQLRRIEATFTDERGRREMLGRDLPALKEGILVLQARVAEIERRLDI